MKRRVNIFPQTNYNGRVRILPNIHDFRITWDELRDIDRIDGDLY